MWLVLIRRTVHEHKFNEYLTTQSEVILKLLLQNYRHISTNLEADISSAYIGSETET